MRGTSRTAELRALGFSDPSRAATFLESATLDGLDDVAHTLAGVPDPGQGLLGLVRLAERAPAEVAAVRGDERAWRKLTRLLGMSGALTDLLVSHPAWLDLFGIEQPIDINPAEEKALLREAIAPGGQILDWESGVAALREAYYRRIVTFAADDVSRENPMEDMPKVAAGISDVVDAALAAALDLARAATGHSEDVRLAIITMGKAGARELNYISDVDVMYVAGVVRGEESRGIEIATKIAAKVAHAVSSPGWSMPLWPLDAGLRPEGADGPLVRTLDSYLAYYTRWAHDWEFQALLKARASAGDADLGRSFVEKIMPLVWSASGRPGFVDSSRAMRARVEDSIGKDSARALKLGRGGLRDVEFTVQLLQLVHGRVDESLRVASTLDALRALTDGGYVARSAGELLEKDYRFLRTLEHRIQLQKFKRSHHVPTGEAELRRIARSMSMTSAHELDEAWQNVRAEVRSLHESIFYRPLLPEAARLSDADISLEPRAARDRLAAIGYRDPDRALAHIAALTEGISRTAKIQRHLLPVLIGWFADGSNPDAALLHFRVLSETMGKTHWYLKLLRDSVAAERLARILSTSEFLAEQIPKHTESVKWLADDNQLALRGVPELRTELESLISRRHEPHEIAQAGRYIRRKEILRLGMGLAVSVIGADEARVMMTRGTEIAIDAGLRAALSEVLTRRGIEAPSRYLIVGMGTLGGSDMGISSDADILFVHEPHVGDLDLADEVANEVATTLIKLLGSGPETPVTVDAGLRPEGKNGPLARSLAAYREYYEAWAEPWERQALLRARPVAGDAGLAEVFMKLVDAVRYDSEFTVADQRAFRRMKARVESERLPRGMKPADHIKLGPGGILDIEWTAQYLQLLYSHEYPSLRLTSTRDVLRQARDHGLLEADDWGILDEAWSFSQRLRMAIDLAGTRRSDIMPHGDTLRCVAELLSMTPASVEDYHQRVNRRARQVIDRVIFDSTRIES